jgi:type I restriction enzyme R subunit
VYLKYKALFDYFDAILIGLTATPKAEVDKNTYELFHLENNNPTYAYELSQAVADTYLVPPKALAVPLKFHREGIRYEQLNEQEKDAYEMTFRDEASGDLPGEIQASALNNWLFNQNTVDKVLGYLMERGIKVEGGDKLGKTIIFARNHRHALYIEERFNALYPQNRGKFLRVIDNFEKKAPGLLDAFSEPSKYPQIAVSVDMLDTGIDVPEVVNLVFFKAVKSKAKYWQMIGRGTRLCPDLFGPGQPKTHFCVFDFCENFEFFNIRPEGIEAGLQESLTQKIFKSRLRLAQLLDGQAFGDEPHQALRTRLLDQLHAAVAQLSDTTFTVRRHWSTVRKFRQRERWDHLSPTDVLELTHGVAGLVLPEGEDELARRFDLMLLNFQLTLPTESSRQKEYVTQLSGIAHHLAKKKNIPAVVAHLPMITALQTDAFWSQVRLPDLERVREELRGLMHFIDKVERAPVYTNFEDTLDCGMVKEPEILPIGSALPNYRLRVERFIRENKDHMTISRLYTNQPITLPELEQLEKILFDGGERGTKEDFQREFGTDKPLTVFIRSIVGLDVKAARTAFSDFLGVGRLSADQITFIDKIIDHLTVNGLIDRGKLFEPPFTDLHDQGVGGIFPESEVNHLLSIIDRINANAGVA